jgi:hypothetical protein
MTPLVPGEGMEPAPGSREPGAARRVAALYVQPGGAYYGLPNVDPWDEARDARTYAGPYPVVAHPPCERWGRYWFGGPSAKVRKIKGDDNGCFAFALGAVRRWGGILEHPAASHAWAHFGLTKPPRAGRWVKADDFGGWTCCVDQGNYGHKAQKATWLYAVGVQLPDLIWGKAPRPANVGEGRRAIRTGICQRLSKRQRAATPPAFRDLLITIELTAKPSRSAEGAKSPNP